MLKSLQLSVGRSRPSDHPASGPAKFKWWPVFQLPGESEFSVEL